MSEYSLRSSQTSKSGRKTRNVSHMTELHDNFMERYQNKSGANPDKSKTSVYQNLKKGANLSIFDRKLIFLDNRKAFLKSIVQNGRDKPIIPNVKYIPGAFSCKTIIKNNLQRQFNKFLEDPTLFRDDDEIIEKAAKKVFTRRACKNYHTSSKNSTVPNTLRTLGVYHKLQLKIMDAKIHEPESSSEIQNAIFHLQNYMKKGTEQDDSRFKQTLDAAKFMHFNLIDYRPTHAPYVPTTIKQLANAIEKIAYENNNWHEVYIIDEFSIAQSVLVLKKLLNKTVKDEDKNNLLIKLTLGELSNLMLLFLHFMKSKPFRLQKEHIYELVKSPLYDNYFRPNPIVKRILSDSMLRGSRTNVDTLSFLMMHINHVWEFSTTPTQCRKRMANIFGPLIVMLEERPVIIPKQNKPVECAIMEAVLDQCDRTFWNNLGSNITNSLFERHNEIDGRSQQQSAVFRYVDDFARNYLKAADFVGNMRYPLGPEMNDYMKRAKRQLAYDKSSSYLYEDLKNDEF